MTSGEATSGEVAPAAASADAQPHYKVDRSHKGEQAPDLIFTDAAGKEMRLADFAGRPLLVNLWATWCAPCIAEMPTLDAVAKAHAADRLVVLPVSQDMQASAKVTNFFADRKLGALKLYLDTENRLGFHYATGMLPTSVLYDAQGREIVRVIGALDWTGADAAALIEEVINGG